MRYPDLETFLSKGAPTLPKGPVALIFVEDLIEVASTLRHHLAQKFPAIVLFAPEDLALPDALEAAVHRVRFSMLPRDALTATVTTVQEALAGRWIFYCFNAEYLFYPFCETRTISELLTFHTEERRDALLTYVIDLYAGDLDAAPDAVSLEDAWLDKSGYYALARQDDFGHGRDRQFDFFGGLRWRFEEHVPPEKRKIDRIALFRARRGLQLRTDHTLNDEEYNTYSCPWHNNLTAAICSFRTAKALKTNAGSTFDIHRFRWHNSTPFEWHSQQLLDLGLMEPGQWF